MIAWVKNNTDRPCPEEDEVRLLAWSLDAEGQLLWSPVRAILDEYYQFRFGLVGIQVGLGGTGIDLLRNSRVALRLGISGVPGQGQLTARPEALPLACESVDLAVLPLTLEIAKDPYQALREIDRVLVPEGDLVLIGFNRWSTWGLGSLFRDRHGQDRPAPPWLGCFYPVWRLRDWLKVLGMEVMIVERKAVFLSLLGSPRLDAWAARLLPFAAGIHVIVARKRRPAIRLMRLDKNFSKAAKRSRALEPVPRREHS